MTRCDQCRRPASSIHALPDLPDVAEVRFACDKHDPGGEWWYLDEPDWQALQRLDQVRPGAGAAVTAAKDVRADAAEASEKEFELPAVEKSPGLATLLSLLVAGAGQCYVNAWWRGLGFLVVTAATALIHKPGTALVMWGVALLAGAVDANSLARRYNAGIPVGDDEVEHPVQTQFAHVAYVLGALAALVALAAQLNQLGTA